MKYWTALQKWWLTGAKKSISRDINKAFDWQKLAWAISTKANRFRAWINKNPTDEFTTKFWETPWEFAVNRWMTKTWDDAVEEATNFYRQSMNEADTAFATIPNKITSWVNKKWEDVLMPILNDLDDRLSYVVSADAWKIKGYINKMNSWEWLTMSEINDIKRVYSQNFKYSILDNVWKDALRSSNLQNNLREWQFDTAKDFGLTNIREINKNTQAWRMFADELAKSQRRWAWNNALSLTDWVALSWWEPTNIALFLWKKAVQSKYIKQWGIKLLSKKTKEPIVKASNLATNSKTNVNNNISNNLNITSTKWSVKPTILKEVKKPTILKSKVEKEPNTAMVFENWKLTKKIEVPKVKPTQIESNKKLSEWFNKSAKERFAKWDFTQTEIQKGRTKLDSLYEWRKIEFDWKKWVIVSKPAFWKVKIKIWDTIKTFDTELVNQTQKKASLDEIKTYLKWTEYKWYILKPKQLKKSN